jgi:hypothetical protein
MLGTLSQRVLPVLQLTRMALVFTAISNAYCTALLLWATPLDAALDPVRMLSITAVSVGLYGFGMSLNDIIDRRRDRQIAAYRPLPSGRVGVVTAHTICAFLGLGAVAGGLIYSSVSGSWMSLVLVVFSGMLICFYDVAGKYLVAPGLLTLGLIRFFHALVPAPRVPVVWHPLLLLNHVTILSAIAYVWEDKRPPLTRAHWWIVLGSLAFIDVGAVVLILERRGSLGIVAALHLTPWLILPAAAVVVFAVSVWQIRRLSSSRRDAGRTLMLYGLLWLIVYDVCFVFAYVGWLPAILMLLFLPVAYFSVQLMRWWSNVLAISQRPEFKRA